MDYLGAPMTRRKPRHVPMWYVGSDFPTPVPPSKVGLDPRHAPLRDAILAHQPPPGQRREYLITLMLVVTDAIYENSEGIATNAMTGLENLLAIGKSRVLTRHIEALTAPTMPPEPLEDPVPVENPVPGAVTQDDPGTP